MDTAVVHQFIDFDRNDYPGEGPLDENDVPTDLINDPITNSAKPVIIPHMGFAYGWDKFTAFVGFTTPYASIGCCETNEGSEFIPAVCKAHMWNNDWFGGVCYWVIDKIRWNIIFI